MAAPAFDLVIFDCDGVLVDSEVVSTETLRRTLAAFGLKVDIAYVRATYLGYSFSTVREDFCRLTGRAMPESFEAAFLERLFAAYRSELRAMPGARDLLAALSGAHCVATSSHVDRAELSLALTGLLPLCAGRIFCASMVKRGKPAPDLFLHAAKSLGAEPARCLVVEDSDAGIAAGRAAGMTVWRFVGGSHFEPSARARAAAGGMPVFDSFAEMAARLAPEAEAASVRRA